MGPTLQPVGGFLDNDFFIILKNSGQDPSNAGSNFNLSSLEVGHWVAQTWPFFDKLPKIKFSAMLKVKSGISGNLFEQLNDQLLVNSK